ncbi:hypothetical protein [Pararhizobium antarcticum]|uniref:Uncharacterized protein n=1 Tax=Pararhizobium antarcticum TaxID=1798805 RepID=A0A657LPT5_9HYPH|nr:hypothetical protein [Pararhizobium antarcticum]OJF93371.1 hypothetical protein AX760_05025 [Pararhizobium antarcticum]OJF95993.1 hypothetical protein AX761_16660 [Rhizobium sp. 58]
MAEVANALMYKLLKRVDGDVTALKDGQREIRSELNVMQGTTIAMHQDIHNIYGLLARHKTRLDRIENRLELRALAEAQSRFEPHP